MGILDFFRKAVSKQPSGIDELIKESRLRLKETESIEDSILDKYKKYSKDDVEKRIMDDHLKSAEVEVQEELRKKSEINEEIDKIAEGVDEETKDKMKDEAYKEQENGELDYDAINDPKKRKEALVCKAAYTAMYAKYTNMVMTYKNKQFENQEIVMDTKRAVEFMGYEKCLDKLEAMHYNRTGKDFSKDKQIQKSREEFKNKFEYTQKGAEVEANRRIDRINLLYKEKEKAHRKYLEALYGNESPQEVAAKKQLYIEATNNLVTNVPSLQEYVQDMKMQQKNEDLARGRKLDNDSIVKNRLDVNSKNEVLSRDQTATEEKVFDSFEKNEAMERQTLEKGYRSADTLEQKEEVAADSIRETVIDENLSQRDHKKDSVSDVKEEVRTDMDNDRSDFLNGLREKNNLGYEGNEEKLKSDAEYDPEKQSAIEEARQKEEEKRKQDQEMVREIKNKKNN